ncbi:MAG: AAA family ATPase [Deltaproteobacteria bacterium]|jgi:predicted ATP-binding protein involved in virulence|nr:AAA family ATPase [Deltaproteobacteria bacterium]
MQIKSIELENFRCFKKIKIDFNSHLTVLIGKNTSGKTTILDVLSAYLNLISSSFLKETSWNASTIDIFKTSDVSYHFNRNDIYSKLEIDDLTLVLQYQQNNDLEYKNKLFTYGMHSFFAIPDSFTHDFFTKFKKILQKYATIFVYYPAHRFLYPTEENNLNNNISSDDVLSPYFYTTSIIENLRMDYSWLAEKIITETMEKSETNNLNYRLPELETVRLALSQMLFDKYENPNFNIEENTITLTEKKSNKIFNFSQLSHGFQSILTIIFDLSRRMAQAFCHNNKDFKPESALSMPAVVLIDEIENHLHPKWQQDVLPCLLNTFPKTQFIVTTHSPQVLTSIEPKNIRFLDDPNSQSVETCTFGANSSDVLQFIFGVNPRPNNEVKKLLDEYLLLVNAGKGKSEEGLELRLRLEKWIHGDFMLHIADLFMKRL